jgi:alanine racemase
MFATSTLYLSKPALRENVRFIRDMLGEKTALVSVLKGNAYGHGITRFAPLAEECGVNAFAVFDAQEALTLQAATKSESRVIVMGMIDDAGIEWAIEHGVEFFVFDPTRLETAARLAREVGKPARVHVELETGMNRTGFDGKQLDYLRDFFERFGDVVSLEGLCTHYAGAESVANHVRVVGQIDRFAKMKNILHAEGVRPKTCHTACSAAAISYPQTRMDLARIGILQYGFWPSPETKIHHLVDQEEHEREDPLRRVLSWRSRVMSIKRVKVGEFVGYGSHYLAQKSMTIAIVPVGYSHGFSRSLTNQGRVLLRGVRAPVVGVVNMNALTIDATEIPDAQIGDEVVLIGKQGDLEISVHSFSEFSDQLNYELLTRLPPNIPRVVEE